MTIAEALAFARRYLQERGLPSAAEDAELIVRSVAERSRAFVLAHPEAVLAPEQETLFHQWLVQRGRRYPLQYLRGKQEFYGREFFVNPAVLIPRPETEILVEKTLQIISALTDPEIRIADIGTGSGCIAISIACEDARTRIVAIDISEATLGIARRNAEIHGVLGRIHFAAGADFAPLGKSAAFHIILSNPPYVCEKDERVDVSVRFEPKHAVFAADKGLEVYRRLFTAGAEFLKCDGRLVVEIGAGSAEKVTALGVQYHWKFEEALKDLADIERCLVFRGPGFQKANR
ncbi:MAG: peptide chain release factor N(5)-glutamine methyltransferase [Acidobacteria bacterium]|nr:peptide chain release factor N(5)-glutamine methyltransferase [Acidobacteriota bacterium]